MSSHTPPGSPPASLITPPTGSPPALKVAGVRHPRKRHQPLLTPFEQNVKKQFNRGAFRELGKAFNEALDDESLGGASGESSSSSGEAGRPFKRRRPNGGDYGHEAGGGRRDGQEHEHDGCGHDHGHATAEGGSDGHGAAGEEEHGHATAEGGSDGHGAAGEEEHGHATAEGGSDGHGATGVHRHVHATVEEGDDEDMSDYEDEDQDLEVDADDSDDEWTPDDDEDFVQENAEDVLNSLVLDELALDELVGGDDKENEAPAAKTKSRTKAKKPKVTPEQIRQTGLRRKAALSAKGFGAFRKLDMGKDATQDQTGKDTAEDTAENAADPATEFPILFGTLRDIILALKKVVPMTDHSATRRFRNFLKYGDLDFLIKKMMRHIRPEAAKRLNKKDITLEDLEDIPRCTATELLGWGVYVNILRRKKKGREVYVGSSASRDEAHCGMFQRAVVYDGCLSGRLLSQVKRSLHCQSLAADGTKASFRVIATFSDNEAHPGYVRFLETLMMILLGTVQRTTEYSQWVTKEAQDAYQSVKAVVPARDWDGYVLLSDHCAMGTDNDSQAQQDVEHLARGREGHARAYMQGLQIHDLEWPMVLQRRARMGGMALPRVLLL